MHVIQVFSSGICYSQHPVFFHLFQILGMIFGSFIGGMADWGGRRTFVILYAIFYALSCMTKRKLVQHIIQSNISMYLDIQKLTFIYK